MTGKTITDLKFCQCRYPTSQDKRGTYLFCAARTESEKSPYCAEHAALCFDRRPAERRRADHARSLVALAMRQRPSRPPANVLNGAHREDQFGRDS